VSTDEKKDNLSAEELVKFNYIVSMNEALKATAETINLERGDNLLARGDPRCDKNPLSPCCKNGVYSQDNCDSMFGCAGNLDGAGCAAG